MMKKLLLAGVVVILLWSGVFSHPVSSQQTDFRVNNLESDLRGLEIRLNQLELTVAQQIRPSGSRTSNNTLPQTGSARTRLPSERDRLIDRLSTLVVELKQQVNTLEKRVTQLESR
jgi:outer membrane murein-binding lipoprotein Lpp